MRANIAADVRMAELEYKLNHLLSTVFFFFSSIFCLISTLGNIRNAVKQGKKLGGHVLNIKEVVQHFLVDLEGKLKKK